MILFVILAAGLLLLLLLFCCLAAGNDPISRAQSDQEQLEYLAAWQEKHSSKSH